MYLQTTRYAGYDCILLGDEPLKLWLMTSVGPHVISINLGTGDKLLALLPDTRQRTPSGRLYTFRGEHRLWHAPEYPERTHVLDDGAARVKEV